MAGNSSPRKAYLVCQGEVVICPQPHRQDRIYVLAPEVDDHVYKAGIYLDEKNVPHGTPPLTLHNVRGASTPFQPPQDVLKFGTTGTPLVNRARLALDLPVPCEIRSGAMEDLTQAGFEVKVGNQPVPQPPKAALILIFEYEWIGSEPPYLKPENRDSGTWDAGIKNGCSAIHVYATGKTKNVEDYGHAQEAFKEAAELVSVKNVSITWSPAAQIPCQRTNDVPPGLCWDQVNLMYYERQKVRPELLGQTAEPQSSDFALLNAAGSSGNCGPVT